LVAKRGSWRPSAAGWAALPWRCWQLTKDPTALVLLRHSIPAAKPAKNSSCICYSCKQQDLFQGIV
jgi:hypothetical protein